MQRSASKPGQRMMVYHVWGTLNRKSRWMTKYLPRGLREYDACRGPVDQAWRAETAKRDGMCWKNVRLHQRAMEWIWPITYYKTVIYGYFKVLISFAQKTEKEKKGERTRGSSIGQGSSTDIGIYWWQPLLRGTIIPSTKLRVNLSSIIAPKDKYSQFGYYSSYVERLVWLKIFEIAGYRLASTRAFPSIRFQITHLA